MGVEVLSAIMSLYHMYFLTFGVEGFPEGPAVKGNPIRHLRLLIVQGRYLCLQKVCPN